MEMPHWHKSVAGALSIMSEDFLIVADAADPVAALVGIAAKKSGLNTRLLSLEEASRVFTVELASSGAHVEPRVPIFLRPANAGSLHDEVERFAWNEAFAAVWSAAALTPATVINRPNVYGWGSQCAFSAALTDFRLGEPIRAPEYFWSGLNQDNPADRADQDRQSLEVMGIAPASGHGEATTLEDSRAKLYHQDLSSWQTLEALKPGRSIRSRMLPPCKGWEQVIVVGDQGWRVTDADLPGDRLEAVSIARAQALDLAFVTVSWAIPQEGDPILVRTNPFPSLDEVQPVATEVLDRLIAKLVPE